MLRTLVALVVGCTMSSLARAEGPCDAGLPLAQGTRLEHTRFNAAHQPIGRTVSTIESSVTDGGKTRAVMVVENFIGPNKASTTRVDVVCDGSTVRMLARNEDVLRDLFAAAARGARAEGGTALGSVVVSDPQVYPLPLKPGLSLPIYRNIALNAIQKTEQESLSFVTGNYITTIQFAVEKKLVGGMNMRVHDIKVVGEESCAVPGGAAPTPCFHLRKTVTSSVIFGKSDINQDPNLDVQKPGPAQTMDEWFVPGVGVTRMTMSMNGRLLIGMELTQLTRP